MLLSVAAVFVVVVWNYPIAAITSLAHVADQL